MPRLSRIAAPVAAALSTLPLFAWACSSAAPTPVYPVDAAADVPEVDAAVDAYGYEDNYIQTASCTLTANADPVQFCTQRTVLGEQEKHGFDADAGARVGWSSSAPYTPLVGDGGTPAHDVLADLALGSAFAAYHHSSIIYADNTITPQIDADLIALAPILIHELTTLPASYDGDLYFRLRNVSAGLHVIGDDTDAFAIDAIADTYGTAIFENYAHPAHPPVSVDGGVGDGGASDAATSSDAGVDAAGGSSDAGVPGTDASDGGYAPPIASDQTIIGVTQGSAVAYSTQWAVGAAYALIDMASRHPENATTSYDMQYAGAETLNYLRERARDPATGLYYTSLVTSSDPGHDTLVDSGNGFPVDALLSDVQGKIALYLYRAGALAAAGTNLLPAIISYPFDELGEEVLTSLNGPTVSLWDGPELLNDAGPAEGNGYFEGYVPSTQTYLTDKTTRSNALIYAALRHEEVDSDIVSAHSWQIQVLQPLITATLPMYSTRTLPTYTLFTVNGIRNQAAYVTATSQTFGPVSLPNDAGPDPLALTYETEATDDVIEGLSEYWYGFVEAP